MIEAACCCYTYMTAEFEQRSEMITPILVSRIPNINHADFGVYVRGDILKLVHTKRMAQG